VATELTHVLAPPNYDLPKYDPGEVAGELRLKNHPV
jgi:hypothetical protein